MRVNDFWGVLGALVTVALVTTIVASKESKSIIKAGGAAFSDSLLAAQGKA
jgi:hypothetical protein